MEKIITIKLKDSYTEEEFQETLVETGKTEDEYVAISQEYIREILEKAISSQAWIDEVKMKIVDLESKKKTRIYND